ncbi:MAG: dockerin type I domain-containing protein, partial [Planctomycetota bacterium]
QGTPGGSGLTITTYDLGFCLTGQWVERFGACCDELTGNCVNNVAEANCSGANQRFAADTLCANMDPPCEPPAYGACCLDGTCIGDFIEVECVSMAGGWFEGESCYASPPFECPGPPACPTEDILFAQEPQTATGGDWDAWDSDTGWPSTLYDNFAGVAGAICDVHWFGFGYDNVATCDQGNVNFDILFYPDNGSGYPDVANPTCVYQNILANRVPTEVYNSTVGLLQGYAWDVVLSPCCTMISGWISIQAIDGDECLFYWLSSPNGLDAQSYYDEGTGFIPTGKDRSLCLTGAYIEVRGACCDDATGICTDDVLLETCTGPYVRFVQDTLCANLAPPCGQGEGACCYPDGTCEITTYAGCVGGDWLGAGSFCSDCPCVLFCLPGMTPEGEPVCSDGYIDTYNGGCNSTPAVFQTITACDMVLCGTTGTFDGGTRDTDWYEVTVTGPGTLYWLMVAGWEGPDGLIFLLEPGPNGCDDLIQHTYSSSPGCMLMQTTHEVPIGEHTYWLWAGPADFTGVPCGSIYYAWAEFECAVGACCFGEECVELTWAECVVNGGEWNGAPSCTPNPCGVDYRGDSNCDGSVNSYDIDGFIAAVSGEANWIAYHGGAPPCDYLGANDVNCDGAVNSYDIDWFITAVGNGVADPCP